MKIWLAFILAAILFISVIGAVEPLSIGRTTQNVGVFTTPIVTDLAKWAPQNDGTAIKPIVTDLAKWAPKESSFSNPINPVSTASEQSSYESVSIGPYTVSFNMNTSITYDVIVEKPSLGVTSDGVEFTRYNVTIESIDSFAFLLLTEYRESIPGGINADSAIVKDVFSASSCEQPELYQPLIDGQSGVLGSCRYPSGDLLIVASYSPESVANNGGLRTKTNFRIVSTFPWEIIRDLLYTLHIEDAENHTKPANFGQDQDLIKLTPGESLQEDNKLANWDTTNSNYETPVISAPKNKKVSTSNSYVPSYSGSDCERVYVKGYYRKDGTYVRPHYRSAPGCG